MISTRSARYAASLAGAAVLFFATSGSAHDFWLIPDMFGFSANTTAHINARSGLRFPAGTPVQPTRVLEARILGARTDIKIEEMAIEGTALRLHTKPDASGQYLVVAALTPPLRPTRTVPANLVRFLRAEGGAAEAARLEGDSALMRSDSVIYTSRSYAATILELGTGGPRAFSRTAGYALEFVPMTDPAHVHVGDTLHIKVLGNGKAVARIGIDAVPASDTAAAAAPGAAIETVSLTADAIGIVHLPLTKAGPWMLRSAFASLKPGTSPSEFEVSRSTYVLNVGAKH